MSSEPAVQSAPPRREAAFAKMHGLGNDFVVLNVSTLARPLDELTIRRLADRRLGIGCDQLLLLDTAKEPLRYRVFNADGGEVEQCGNGARCLARYIADHGLAPGPEIRMESAGGPVTARVADDDVSISLGVPHFAPADLPFDAPAEAMTYEIEAGDENLAIGALSVGNPHAVIEVEDVDDAPVANLGPQLERHPRFPRRVNVGFLQVLAPDHCRLRVYERGAGETPACGTGAAAAAVWGIAARRLQSPVTVSLAGGDLVVEWAGPGEFVWLTGPATPVFEGRIEL
ncbi:MAG TPA: diaminopimelate epimerase [Gammaproteobacteria bacterium]|jgi:diaminopimelate epimerase|nr:diaminopimelate epimerase [Gammaproteobacteria bacterium]